jgi:hypothetical protein
MTEFIKNKFDEIWNRIKTETPLKNLTQLAEITGITQSGLSKAKRRNEFSASWAYTVGKKYGLLTEWIMTGEGPKKLEEINRYSNFKLLDQFREWLTEEVAKEPSRKEWFEIQLLDSFKAFKEWKEEKEESEAQKDTPTCRKVA